MRDGAGPRERVIGIICLALTVGIVGAFVAYARKPRPAFFSVPPELQPAAIAPDIKHALSLLPAQPAPGWELDRSGPEVYTGEAMARPLAESAEEIAGAGVRRLFQGRYLDLEDTRRQLTVRVFEMTGPGPAKKLADAKRPKDAVGESLGRGGWRGGDGAIGFWGGRYYTHVFANEAARGATLTPQLLAREVASRQVAYDEEAPRVAATDGAHQASGAPAPTNAANSVLPAIEGGAWVGPAQIATFDPTNLWEKINGRAEAYLAYDFRKMTFGTYRSAAKATDVVDVYVYEMGEATKAFGIYQAERPSNAAAAKIGADGYASASGLFFCKGKAYVQIIGGESAALTAEQYMQIGQAIAAGIADEGGQQWADKMLPSDGRVDGSMEFLTADVFSLDFLHDVFSARYRDGETETVLFIHQAADAKEAAGLFEKYAAAIESLGGKVVKREENEEGGYAEGDISGEFDIIFWKGRYFGGANAAPNLEMARNRVLALRSTTDSSMSK